MDFGDLWGQEVFKIGNQSIILGRIIATVPTILVLYVLAYMLRKKWLERFFEQEVDQLMALLSLTLLS